MTKDFLQQYDNHQWVWTVSAIAALASGIVAATFRRAHPTPVSPCLSLIVFWLGLLGVLSALGFVFLTGALFHLNAPFFALIDNALYPLSIAIFGRVFFRERIDRRLLFGIITSVSGLVLFFSGAFTTTTEFGIGCLFAVLTPLCFALSVVCVKKLLAAQATVTLIVFWRFFLVAMAMLVVLMWRGHNLEVIFTPGVVAVALFGYTLPMYVSFFALRHLPASHFACVILIIPVFSFVISALAGKIHFLELTQIAGLTLVLVGIGVSIFKRKYARLGEGNLKLDPPEK